MKINFLEVKGDYRQRMRDRVASQNGEEQTL